MKNIFTLLFLLTFVIGFSWTSSLTEDAPTLDKDVIELETNFSFANSDPVERELGYSLKYGISSKLDFAISFPMYISKSTKLGDLGFSVKYNLINKKSFLMTSFFMDFTPNNGTYSTFLVFTKDLSFIITHFNIGYNYLGNSNDNGTISTSFAFEFVFTERFTIFSDISMEEIDDFSANAQFSGLLGFAYNILQHIDLDMGMQVPLNDIFSETIYKIGFTFGL